MPLGHPIAAPVAPSGGRDVPAVRTLRRVWLPNCLWEEGALRWRSRADLPAAGACGNAPSDPQAPSAKKRDPGGGGDHVPLSETGDDDLPHRLPDGETTPAPLAARAVRSPLHQSQEHHDLLPEKHLGETGEVDAEARVSSQHDSGVDRCGPRRDESHGQAREETGLAADHVVGDGQRTTATDPAGNTRSRWSPVPDRRGHPVGKITLATQDGGPGSHRQTWTHTPAASPRRTLPVRPPDRSHARPTARQRPARETFPMPDHPRAGIEGTHSQGIRVCGGRQARSQGQAKVRLPQAFTAAALHCSRRSVWVIGHSRATTRHAALVRLARW